jgi:hypothetical protein
MHQCCQWLCLLTLVSLAGCGGCQPDSGENLTREEFEKRAREQRESLVMNELLSLPTDSETKLLTAKAGHWVETRQQFKSNREDLQVLAVGSVAQGSELARVPGTDMINEFTRRTSLPKGQTKNVDLQYFVPFSGQQSDPLDFNSATRRLNFRTELLNWPLLTPLLSTPDVKPVNELKEHEFQLAVISPHTLGYEFLKSLDAVFWRGADLMQEERTRSYVLAYVQPEDNQYAFPHSMLTMSAIAVLLWDDVSVDNLSSDQQQAMVDWLHWGGTLVINGPSSWSRLQNSFLSPYLPANQAETVELNTEDFAELSSTWETIDQVAPGENEPLSIVGPAVGGLRFQLNARGDWLPGSGQLVAETSLGRGRIVVTAFPLRDPRIFRWKYFSSLFSTGLLRRPARTIARNTQDRALEQVWDAPWQGSERDPRLHSNFRILSRDLPLTSGSAVKAAQSERASTTTGAATSDATQADASQPTTGQIATRKISVSDFNTFTEQEPKQSLEAIRWGNTGAAWNDYSGLSVQALSTLKSAAGIELPSRSTIIKLLAGYLLCLVPLNWLVFRLLGRLEYAWLAAPILALVAVGVVTRVARLDIGFARRTTEVSVLELHGSHPRGHLTQYIALYTSLSTNYAIDFPERNSLALPMGDLSRARRRAAAESRNLRTNYGRSAGVTLEPLTVYSNSTEMLHAEQVVDLPGGLVLGQTASGKTAVKNESGLQLRGALVIHSPSTGVIEGCWLGELAQGQAAELVLEDVERTRPWEQWDTEPITRLRSGSEPTADSAGTKQLASLWIGGVLQELLLKTPLVPGQMRLLAYTDDRPGNLQVTPAEDQLDARCVVVAHLSSPRLGPVQPDRIILSRDQSAQLEPIEVEPPPSQ